MPNYWAENFIYGFDPKFIMAITAKVNMVLHGDGSAHIFKYDAFSSFSKYKDTKLRPIGKRQASVAKEVYPPDMCETFDVVLSNPPFGITLSSDTLKHADQSFELSSTLPSEALFIERCFQLVKPKGRLGLVLPESIFNAADNLQVRLFLYRMFHIKAIVSLPRNVFIDTPTLTSLLFAQKNRLKKSMHGTKNGLLTMVLGRKPLRMRKPASLQAKKIRTLQRKRLKLLCLVKLAALCLRMNGS